MSVESADMAAGEGLQGVGCALFQWRCGIRIGP